MQLEEQLSIFLEEKGIQGFDITTRPKTEQALIEARRGPACVRIYDFRPLGCFVGLWTNGVLTNTLRLHGDVSNYEIIAGVCAVLGVNRGVDIPISHAMSFGIAILSILAMPNLPTQIMCGSIITFAGYLYDKYLPFNEIKNPIERVIQRRNQVEQALRVLPITISPLIFEQYK